MKIGIITFHFVSNQGGVLQAFAMQKYLEKQGHEVYIIDYQPSYHTVRYDALKNPFLYSRWYWKKFQNRNFLKRCALTGRSFIRCMVMNLKKTDAHTKAQFERFQMNYLGMTKRYRSLKQLRKDPPQMDVYISGSDQLWNPDLLDQKFDEAYFLKFGSEETRRVVYAVSIGKDLSEQERKDMNSLCSELDAISVREYHKETIESMDRDVHVCIDPTLLLHAEDYAKAESECSEKDPYIFVYGFETSADIQSAVELAKKKYQCKVINGSPHRVKLNGDVISARGYGPDKFLSYIKNAQCVVTNSFHGTTFSIIYSKDFITVSHSTRGRRMQDLLGKLELNYRLWNCKEFSFDQVIDYVQVNKKLEHLRENSIYYLEQALLGKKGEEICHWEEETNDYNQDVCATIHAQCGWYLDNSTLQKSASGGGQQSFLK